MLSLGSAVRVYLAVDPVDMRRGHDGLAAIVRNQWGADLFGGDLFAFVGRRGDRIKILTWSRGGLVLYYKRLERGHFRLPAATPGAKTVHLDATSLAMLLDGIDVARVSRPVLWEPRRAAAARDRAA